MFHWDRGSAFSETPPHSHPSFHAAGNLQNTPKAFYSGRKGGVCLGSLQSIVKRQIIDNYAQKYIREAEAVTRRQSHPSPAPLGSPGYIPAATSEFIDGIQSASNRLRQELLHFQNHLLIERQVQFSPLTVHVTLLDRDKPQAGSCAHCLGNGAHLDRARDTTTRKITQLSLAFATPLLFTDRKDLVLTLRGMERLGVGAARPPHQRWAPSKRSRAA